MRVKSPKGKQYILVTMDDFSHMDLFPLWEILSFRRVLNIVQGNLIYEKPTHWSSL